jgi:hypothetical protein
MSQTRGFIEMGKSGKVISGLKQWRIPEWRQVGAAILDGLDRGIDNDFLI